VVAVLAVVFLRQPVVLAAVAAVGFLKKRFI
jgi:hypothetical protein